MRTSNSDKVRVVVAGQEVPDANTIEWGHCCETYELLGIRDAEYRMPVVKAKGWVIPAKRPLDWLAGICHALDGCPDKIMKIIQALPRRH